nr:hypothetical protein [Nocardia abscessus]
MGIEFLEPLLQCGVHLPQTGLFVSQRGIENGPGLRDELNRKRQGGVAVDDGLFDLIGREVWQVTQPVLASTAEEIAVPAACLATRLCVDQARSPAHFAASFACEITLEVVLEHPVTLTESAAHVHDVLHAVEQFLRDDRLMFAGVQFILVVDPPGVVRVLKHPVQHLERHWTLWQFADCAGSQAEVSHGGLQPFQAVSAAGVQLECLPHERCSSFIERHAVDELAPELDAHVEVAEPSDAQRATVHGLGAHLLLNVQALQLVHQIVHDVQHAFHGLGVRTLAEVFFGADQTNPDGAELSFNDRGIEPIPECPRAHVDDDVLDLRVDGQVLQQFPNNGSLLDRLRRVAGLDELLDDLGTKGICLLLPPFALGEDGQAIRVDINGGLHLSFGGDTKEQNGFAVLDGTNSGTLFSHWCLLGKARWNGTIGEWGRYWCE